MGHASIFRSDMTKEAFRVNLKDVQFGRYKVSFVIGFFAGFLWGCDKHIQQKHTHDQPN